MDPYVLHRGPFSGEIGSAVRTLSGCSCFPYAIRTADTGELVFDGFAGDLQEAVQTVALCLDYMVDQAAV